MENLNIKTSAFAVENLSFTYKKGRKLLENINFSIVPGDILTVLGPNGAGKTTLLNCMLNNDIRYHGDIYLFGRNLQTFGSKEYSANVAYVPQLSKLNFEYSVEDFVLMGVNPQKRYFEQPNSHDYSVVRESLEIFGIQHLAGQLMSEISGGERQLAYIARALTQKPKIIIMDEPTSALDYSNQYKVIQILKKLNKEGYTVILTSHNPDYAFMLGGYVGMLYRNQPFKFGTVTELMTDDNLSGLYGTEIKVTSLIEYNTKVCVRVNSKGE